MAAFDVLLNNADRLPVLFDTEGNLGNVILEPGSDGSVVCCAPSTRVPTLWKARRWNGTSRGCERRRTSQT